MIGGEGERTFDNKPETFRLLMLSIKEEDTTKNKMRHRKHIFKHQKVPHAPFKIHNASQALTHATTFLIQKIIINSKLYYHIWSNQQLQKKIIWKDTNTAMLMVYFLNLMIKFIILLYIKKSKMSKKTLH
jgi:hypothetical protein